MIVSSAPARRAGADPAGRDGGALPLPVGQGLLRRRPVRQDRLPGARDALAGRGVPGADRRPAARRRSISAGSTSTTRRVYDMICAGDTIGVFQIESRAQIQMLPRTQPAQAGGSGRPGRDRPPRSDHRRRGQTLRRAPPAERGPASCRSSRSTTTPVWSRCCAETHGVDPLPGAGARRSRWRWPASPPVRPTQLRRAMTRKRSARGDDRALGRSSGTARRAHGVSDGRSPRRSSTSCSGSPSYGFPKAHAAAFAVLAYQSCWLKYYYPAEFLCALLNNQPMGFYPPHVLTNDAKRHGVRILPPDVNLSGVRCTVEGGNAIRIGLGYVEGLGEEAAAADRRRAGRRTGTTARWPISSAGCRSRPRRSENLIAVGAFDRFGLGRREALWQLGLFIPSRGFGAARTADGHRPAAPAAAAGRAGPGRAAADGRLGADGGRLRRPRALAALSPARPAPAAAAGALSATTADLRPAAGRRARVQIAGLIVCRQRPGTAKGIPSSCWRTSSGWSTSSSTRISTRSAASSSAASRSSSSKGGCRKREDTINIVATDIWPLEEAKHGATAPAAPDQPVAASTDPVDTPAEASAALVPASHDYY